MGDHLIPHRCALVVVNVFVAVFADDTALGPPIYWCLFFAADVIGLALPTDVENGIKWWIVIWVFSSLDIPLGDLFLD